MHLRDGLVTDVTDIADVADVAAPGSGARSDGDLDLSGYLLLPAPADAHAHLDKALSAAGKTFPEGDLWTAVESWLAHAGSMSGADILDRARRAALRLLHNGATAIRSHVDILPGEDPLRGVAALVQLRAELSGLLNLQLVVGAGEATPDTLVHAALDLGADLVGGAPHFASDPRRELRRLVDIARVRGVGIDLHTDESADTRPTLDDFALLVSSWPPDRPATASHCVRQGMLADARLRRTIDRVAASPLSVVTLPITNLYLQGRQGHSRKPRGLPPLRPLLDAGVTVGAGGDNVQDAFNPLGRSDPLETAMLLVVAGHVSVAEAWRIVSDGSRRAMRLAAAGIRRGEQADFLAIKADGLASAIADAPADRIVLHRGRVVAHSRTEAAIATPRR